jgi:hypothetical protein
MVNTLLYAILILSTPCSIIAQASMPASVQPLFPADTVQKMKIVGRGTVPDFEIHPTPDDIIRNHDRVFNYVLELIKKN